MSFSFIPQYAFRCVTDISANFIKNLGIGFLMIDLDNTIAAYNENSPADEVKRWIDEMKSAGIDLFIISNSRRTTRVEAFSKILDIGFINKAYKPSPKAVLNAMTSANASADNSALLGDQILTDTLAANLAGITSIIVRPRMCSNLFLALRFFIEAPFRAACKNKSEALYE